VCYPPSMRSPVRSKPMLATLPALAALLALLAGCTTEPINPDGCRAIENARCEAAPSCTASYPNLDVEDCKRFYHNQCLHGMAATGDPGQPRIDQCVVAIQMAGACAKEGKTSCDLPVTLGAEPCSVIGSPELFQECDFLAAAPVATDAGAETDALDENAETGAEDSSVDGSD
jgi:hypothetical protein